MSRPPDRHRVFRLPQADRDVPAAVDDELRFHLDMLTDELRAGGHPTAEARRRAAERFGDVETIRARCATISASHEGTVRRSDRLAGIRQDVAYAMRALRSAPGFTLVVLLTLALGIGATTAIFSVVRGVLLRPLPFPAAERVVRVWPANPTTGFDRGEVSQTELPDWERGLPSFEAIGAFRTLGAGRVFGDDGDPAYAPTTYVSKGFFAALGTPALLGRTLQADEFVPGPSRVVVSHGFWQRQLGGDSAAVGRAIRLDGASFTVVGVMPPDFAFPTADVAVWMPQEVFDADDVGEGRAARWMEIVGRLRPGVTPAQARAEVAAFQGRLATTYPESNAGWTDAALIGVRESIVGRVELGLLVLLGAVALVLLIVCVNVANLLLVRATGRGRELALRAALGAGRARIVRLLLTESLLLATIGGALGVVLAWWGVRALVALSGEFLPRAADVRIDATVLVFALGLALVTGVLFGVWPALRAASPSLTNALKESARGSTGGAAANRARGLLVAVEVALAVVLVAGAALMLRSFERLTSVDVGFRPEGLLMANFSLPDPVGTTDQASEIQARLDMRRRVIERVRAVPGVVSAGAAKYAPFSGGDGEAAPFTVPGTEPPAPGDEPRVLLQPVSADYLRALGATVEGRVEDVPSGDSTAAPTAVISRRMAERFWPDGNAIGETFAIGTSEIRVSGIAGDVRMQRLDSAPGFTAYVSPAIMSRSHMSLVVRGDGDPTALVAPVRAAIREVLPNQAFEEIVPMRDKLGEAASTPRFFTVLVTIFGALALVLAAVGLYGVVSYVVSQRQREIGVRVALGAPPADVVALMLRRGMTPVLAGLAVGVVAALLATRLLGALLYDVSATDPATYVGVALLLATVGLVASWIPSRRAARVDPTVTLRAE